jgi:cystathionine beta-lyase/cystathionine gamma-synthase
MELPKLKILKTIGGFHGVSAVFPKLSDVIDYEEGNILVNQAYPRFVTHPIVKIIENKYKKRFKAMGAISCQSYETAVFFVIDFFFKKGNKIYFDDGLPLDIYQLYESKFPNLVEKLEITEADIVILNGNKGKFENFVEGKRNIGLLGDNSLDESSQSLKFEILIYHDKENDIGIVLFFSFRYLMLNILRRHCGFNVSSRKICRNKKPSNEKYQNYQFRLKERLSKLENCRSEHCYLYPSGMTAVFSSIFSLLSEERPKFFALGSLYVDTIRILERWPKNYNLAETTFIREKFKEKLEKTIDNETSGIIVEIPSNPLIQLIDIDEIVKIAHSKGAKVIVDNTVASPYNFNPLDHNVDIVVHSTTKFLSGKNNHIGGVLLTNDAEIGSTIKSFNELTNLSMSFDDMKVLLRNLKNFEKRMKKINENGEKVANFLNNHGAVEKVYYPALKEDPNNLLMKKYLRGGSGLLSFILKESTKENAEKFYDSLLPPILKGPSLGSEKTLLSPYVIMAHYEDSKEELEQLGFDFYLMRLSVGIEPIDKILKSLENGLKQLV